MGKKMTVAIVFGRVDPPESSLSTPGSLVLLGEPL